jgi:DNA modification methylase
MAATTSVWHIPAESARRVGHPAPFPVALVERLIHLYTFEGEAVLDPFMGSGSTAVAAVRADRRFIGYEIEPSYISISRERVSRTTSRCLSA